MHELAFSLKLITGLTGKATYISKAKPTNSEIALLEIRTEKFQRFAIELNDSIEKKL